MPVPKSKGDDITIRIEALSKRKDISPFEVKSLQREIDKLLGESAAESYMLSGMLSAMLGNREKSRALHEKSMALEYDVVGLFNYGVSMKKVGELSHAKDLFARAAQITPGDSEIFEHQLQTISFLLDYQGFEELVGAMQKARPEVDFSQDAGICALRENIAVLEALGVSLEEFSKYGLHAEQVMLQHELSAIRVAERLSHFDGVSHIFVEFFLDTNSVDALYNVNESLMDVILSDDSLHSWEKVVLSVAREDQRLLERDGLAHSAA